MYSSSLTGVSQDMHRQIPTVISDHSGNKSSEVKSARSQKQYVSVSSQPARNGLAQVGQISIHHRHTRDGFRNVLNDTTAFVSMLCPSYMSPFSLPERGLVKHFGRLHALVTGKAVAFWYS